MNDKTFVDTNVLIYAHDNDAGAKHRIAAALLRELWSSRTGVLSVQVLQEFYVNVTRKIPKPLSRAMARDLLAHYAVWNIQTADAPLLARASEIEEKHRLSFWDALIVAAAKEAGAQRILSEDMGNGQRIAGVRIENPFL